MDLEQVDPSADTSRAGARTGRDPPGPSSSRSWSPRTHRAAAPRAPATGRPRRGRTSARSRRPGLPHRTQQRPPHPPRAGAAPAGRTRATSRARRRGARCRSGRGCGSPPDHPKRAGKPPGWRRSPIRATIGRCPATVAGRSFGWPSPRSSPPPSSVARLRCRTPTAAALSRWTGGIDLYRSGVFTTQKTWLWCTAADVQIIRNIVDHTTDHTRANQQRYFDYMRAHDRYSIPVSDGTDPGGWAAGLRHYVDSRYRVVASTSFNSALRSAVTNLRKTNRPVAITVQHGNHGWVLTGFTATADPAVTTHFTVTSVRVVGPLWGLQNRSYGYDMRPDTKLTPSQFRTFFTPWHYGRIRMAWEGDWVSIQAVPTSTRPHRRRGRRRPRRPRRSRPPSQRRHRRPRQRRRRARPRRRAPTPDPTTGRDRRGRRADLQRAAGRRTGAGNPDVRHRLGSLGSHRARCRVAPRRGRHDRRRVGSEPGCQSVGASPNWGNSSAPKVVISAIRPSTTRRTSSLKARKIESPGARM